MDEKGLGSKALFQRGGRDSAVAGRLPKDCCWLASFIYFPFQLVLEETVL